MDSLAAHFIRAGVLCMESCFESAGSSSCKNIIADNKKRLFIEKWKEGDLMRLWHEKLIPELPRQQLLGQHRECCALRGNGWNKPHSTVNYIFHHSPYKLYQYHMKVMNEMKRRGYKVDQLWENPAYRGRHCIAYTDNEITSEPETTPIYPEHDITYLKECLYNLASKNISLHFGRTYEEQNTPPPDLREKS